MKRFYDNFWFFPKQRWNIRNGRAEALFFDQWHLGVLQVTAPADRPGRINRFFRDNPLPRLRKVKLVAKAYGREKGRNLLYVKVTDITGNTQFVISEAEGEKEYKEFIAKPTINREIVGVRIHNKKGTQARYSEIVLSSKR
nr:hypothetical protein [uncultured bacterium]